MLYCCFVIIKKTAVSLWMLVSSNWSMAMFSNDWHCCYCLHLFYISTSFVQENM